MNRRISRSGPDQDHQQALVGVDHLQHELVVAQVFLRHGLFSLSAIDGDGLCEFYLEVMTQ